MTIDLPVHVDLLETDARLAWRIVDADGVVIPWGTVVAALNTPPRNAGVSDVVNNILDALEEHGLATWGVLSDEDAEACRAEARDIIDGAMDDLYRHIPDRPAVDAPKDGTP